MMFCASQGTEINNVACGVAACLSLEMNSRRRGSEAARFHGASSKSQVRQKSYERQAKDKYDFSYFLLNIFHIQQRAVVLPVGSHRAGDDSGKGLAVFRILRGDGLNDVAIFLERLCGIRDVG